MEKKLPKNWINVKLNDLGTIQSGGTPKRSNSNYWTGDIPWVKISDLKKWYVEETTELITEEGLNNSSTKIFPKGTILFTIFATIGKVGVLSIDACTNQAIAGITPVNEIEHKFLTYALIELSEVLKNEGKGVAQKNINLTILKDLNIPLPPLKEQQRIVAKLDTLFTHLENLKTRLHNIPTLLKHFRQAILTQAVTGKLTQEWREGRELEDVDLYLKNITEDLNLAYKLKCEEAKKNGVRKPKDQRKNKKSDKRDINLYNLPNNWRYRRAEDLSYLITDGVHFKPTYIVDGVPFLSVKNVRPFKVLKDNCKYISKEHHTDYIKRCNPENNDILYTKVGATYGYAAKVDFDYEFSIYVSLALIKPSRLLNSDYLELLFNSPLVFNQARHRVSGSGVPDLHLIEIRDFKLPIPPKEEQTEIVKRVENLFTKADQIEVQYQQLKEKIDSLPQAILAKAFKGELVPQLPTDGDAKDLLAEIQQLKKALKPTKKTVVREKKNVK